MNSSDDYRRMYQLSTEEPEKFWDEIAKQFDWIKPYQSVLEWDFNRPDVRWFDGGKLNITQNCLDRHANSQGDQVALLWEPNDPQDECQSFSYNELLTQVCRCANGLKSIGIKKGDRVILYMPMIPELAFAVLACARIGAVHSVVFAGFSARALADRINDAEAKLVICADYNRRGNKNIPVKAVVDQALNLSCPSVENVLVYRHTGEDISWNSKIDRWWHEMIDKQPGYCDAEIMDSEDALFILYTSGSTGKPKGVVHSCGGYMVYTCYSFLNVFQYQSGDVYWCTADIGWITGHSYILYGPLLAGATTMMFEGVPTWPDAGRFWHICEKHGVNQFYTAPTAIRALMAHGDEWPDGFDLRSLKVLGTVGEPINEEAWHWYHDKVGKGRCAIADTWWQTETGGIMISPLPGITDSKPTYASYPLPGIQPVLVDEKGRVIEENEVEGMLCIRFPWPSILRTIYGDHDRCRQVYFSAFPGMYFSGDGARRDQDGRIRVIGRVDDVINVSGHRLGTAEIEDAIDETEHVIESAVVGYPHEIKGQGIFAFVIAGKDVDGNHLSLSIRESVTQIIGPIARPDQVRIVSGLPKTRSGKIMRRILRKIAAGELEQLGDISTLVNPEIIQDILKEK